jgi:L-ornithine Nalpha-acyltransferase
MWPIEPPFGTVIPFSPRLLGRPKRAPKGLPESPSALPRVLGRYGNFEIRLATRKEVRKAQRLRYKVFYEEGGAIAHGPAALVRRDLCRFDKFCDHLLIVDLAARNRFGRVKPKIVGTYRLLRGEVAARNGGFYSAGEFDIAPLLERHAGKNFLELGRSCVHAKYRSKRVIELLWRGLWTYAQHYRIDVMFGCASLPGINPLALALPLSFLHHHAAAEADWQVRPSAGRAVPMNALDKSAIDQRKGLAALPPLIKAYLRVGAKFGDGAVIDPQFGTIDVFTVMPVAEIERRYIAYYGSDGGENAAA